MSNKEFPCDEYISKIDVYKYINSMLQDYQDLDISSSPREIEFFNVFNFVCNWDNGFLLIIDYGLYNFLVLENIVYIQDSSGVYKKINLENFLGVKIYYKNLESQKGIIIHMENNKYKDYIYSRFSKNINSPITNSVYNKFISSIISTGKEFSKIIICLENILCIKKIYTALSFLDYINNDISMNISKYTSNLSSIDNVSSKNMIMGNSINLIYLLIVNTKNLIFNDKQIFNLLNGKKYILCRTKIIKNNTHSSNKLYSIDNLYTNVHTFDNLVSTNLSLTNIKILNNEFMRQHKIDISTDTGISSGSGKILSNKIELKYCSRINDKGITIKT